MAAAASCTGAWADARAGLRYTFHTSAVRALAAGFFLAGLSAGDDVALPFLARDLGAGERAIGALYAAVGAGLIAGYVLLARRRTATKAGAGLVLGAAVAGAGNALTGMAPAVALAVAFQIVRGAGLAVYETFLQTTLQREVPGELLGRVVANAYGAVNVGACVGLLAAGPLLDTTSARVVLIASGGMGLLSAWVSSRAGRMSA